MTLRRLPAAAAVFLAANLIAGDAAALCKLTDNLPSFLNERDQERFAGLLESRARGLARSLQSESAKDRELLAGIMTSLEFDVNGAEKTPALPGVSGLHGDYSCQVIKLGGLTKLTVYKAFKCRIDALDGTANIEKLTGSQRFSGMLVPWGEGYAYAGALHYGDENPVEYGKDAERDQTGCLTPTNFGSFVLEMPKPKFESDHDIVILTTESE